MDRQGKSIKSRPVDGKKNTERGREILAWEKDLCSEVANSKASKHKYRQRGSLSAVVKVFQVSGQQKTNIKGFEQKRPPEKEDSEGSLYMDAETVRRACMVAYLTAKAVVYSCFNDKHFPYGFCVCGCDVYSDVHLIFVVCLFSCAVL